MFVMLFRYKFATVLYLSNMFAILFRDKHATVLCICVQYISDIVQRQVCHCPILFCPICLQYCSDTSLPLSYICPILYVYNIVQTSLPLSYFLNNWLEYNCVSSTGRKSNCTHTMLNIMLTFLFRNAWFALDLGVYFIPKSYTLRHARGYGRLVKIRETTE